jgi:hypothetical protein
MKLEEKKMAKFSSGYLEIKKTDGWKGRNISGWKFINYK